jgi:hypothetical protein
MFPVSGAFAVFGARFVSPALGFTLGGFSCALPLIHSMFCLDRVELLAAMVKSRSYHINLPNMSCLFRSLSIRKAPVTHARRPLSISSS